MPTPRAAEVRFHAAHSYLVGKPLVTFGGKFRALALHVGDSVELSKIACGDIALLFYRRQRDEHIPEVVGGYLLHGGCTTRNTAKCLLTWCAVEESKQIFRNKEVARLDAKQVVGDKIRAGGVRERCASQSAGLERGAGAGEQDAISGNEGYTSGLEISH